MTDSVSSRTQVFAASQYFSALPRRLIGIITVWRRRARSRRELAALSDLELRDIGYPAERTAEIHKPFWRA
jgi:uncharacterized protein YjiS (DUF1127 family)